MSATFTNTTRPAVLTTSRSANGAVLRTWPSRSASAAAAAAGVREIAPHALDAAAEARFVHGLQKIVDGAGIERAHGVFLVRCREDHDRHRVGADGLDDVEAVELGHLHVEEDDIGREPAMARPRLRRRRRIRDAP